MQLNQVTLRLLMTDFVCVVVPMSLLTVWADIGGIDYESRSHNSFLFSINLRVLFLWFYSGT